jgi:hypothetical protein
MAREIHPEPHTAEIEGDFVVFLIGMRPNKLWKLRKWWPVFTAMRPMVKELSEHPDKGLLAATAAWIGGPAVVQYWRSFEHLERFARDADDLHLPAWKRFNKAVGSSGDVGIWHETYKVAAGAYECIYRNMPVLGLAAAGRHVPIRAGRERAAERITTAGAQ